MALPLAEYRPAIIVDVYLDGGVRRVASKDFYDSSGNYYKGSLVETPNISRTLTDLYYGVEETTSITLQFANAASNVDGTWDDIVVTNADELRGRSVLIQRNDPSDGTSFELRGKIVEYSLGPIVEVMVETRKDYALDTLLPQDLVTNDAPWTATAIDIGKPVNICFGKCRNVPLRNIQNDRVNDYYDYLIGYGQIEGLWIDHVNGFGIKRDGVLVNTAEYGTNAPDYDNGEIFDGTQVAPFPGYAFIRFTREQMNFSGAFHNLTADVKGLVLDNYEEEAERNFAEVIEHLLFNTTWGLSESVDTASFATSAGHLPVASYMCDGAITEQRRSNDILNDLLFVSRATLVRGSDGEWEMTVDTAGASVLNLGDNDGYYNNCKVVKTSAMNASEAIYTAIVHYDIDSYNTDLPYKELSHATGLDFGITRTYDLPFVMENLTAKKVLSYITRRSKYSDKTALIHGGMECRDLLCGDIITLTAPARNISNKDYMIEGITKNVASFELRCREYDANIYGDEVIANPTSQTSSKPTVLGPIAIIGPVTLGDGSTQPGSITMEVAPGEGDVSIKSGKDDFTTVDPGFIVGIDDSDGDTVKLYLGDATNYVYWDGTSLVVSGNISAVTGTIGGWTIGATSLSSGNITLDSATPSIELGAATDYLTGTGIWLGNDGGTYKMHIGNPAGDHLKWDGTNLIITGTVAAGSSISETTSDTFTINSDLDDVNVQLIFGRTTGGNAYIQWNGAQISFSDYLHTDFMAGSITNTILGVNVAATGNLSGANNVLMGYYAARDITDGSHNIIIGNNAGLAIQGGDYCVIVGNAALQAGGNSNYCVALGAGAGHDQTGAEYGVYLGYNAAYFNRTGGYNTWIGSFAGYGVNNQSNTRNTGLGYKAGFAIETGTDNTLLGHEAGDIITTGDFNIIIGSFQDPTAGNVDYQLNIGGLIYADMASSGKMVGIDKTPIVLAAKLDIDQYKTDGAIPVLRLDQADIDEEFISLIGTAKSGMYSSLIDEGDQQSETREGWIKVHIQDDGTEITDGDYYIPFYSVVASMSSSSSSSSSASSSSSSLSSSSSSSSSQSSSSQSSSSTSQSSSSSSSMIPECGTYCYQTTIDENAYIGSGVTLRYIIDASHLDNDASKIKVKFGHAGTNYSTEACYIGHQGVGDVYDFDGNQQQVLVGASGSFTITEDTWSDEITIDLDKTKNIVFSFYLTSTMYSYNSDTEADNDMYAKAGNDAATTDTSGYSLILEDVSVIVEAICQTAS